MTMTQFGLLSLPAELVPSLKKRMTAKIVTSASGCHEWVGTTTAEGYGMTGVSIDGKWRAISAHRAAWMVHKGPIPADHVLDHLCRVRACVNVEHLEPVTANENTWRGHAVRNGVLPLARPSFVDEKIWKAAKAAAKTRGDDLGAIIQDFITEYAK